MLGRYMADLVIGYFQTLALHVVDHAGEGREPLQHEAAVAEALPQPMFKDNWETHASRCQTDADFQSLVAHADVGRSILPLPAALVSLGHQLAALCVSTSAGQGCTLL